MAVAILADLPPPPPGRVGWPWAVESISHPSAIPNGGSWPKITVVTPSYNQGQFIEQTIRSVLLQGYPNLEYIIMDGGSHDNSCDIIRKYAPWITHWESQSDKGQADAINRGLGLATGSIFNWINSDDLLEPGALFHIAAAFEGSDAVAGACMNFSGDSMDALISSAMLTAVGLTSGSPNAVFHQPALWLRRDYVTDCGGINPAFHYVFDWDLTIRYLYQHPKVRYVPHTLARFRLHESSKTVALQSRFQTERNLVLRHLAVFAPGNRLRRCAARRLRQFAWWDLLREITSDPRATTLSRAFKIVSNACSDPAIRWSRLTLGALKRSGYDSADGAH